ncbi:MAG: hypothetical protein QOH58_2778 [Thermoleophilaceae bacterium]|jgi:uncharacterized protein YbcI|nr:hypothetical protein [Thermoleophilaceae bacterium]
MDANMSPNETSSERRGLEMAELSRGMVRIYKERFGRGPTKAHSVYATTDLLISTLENSLTPAERSLVQMGEHQRLRDIRMFFQHATEQEFVETVEHVTGRRVRAFVSGIDTNRDVASEVFYLEPLAPDADS